MEALAKLGIDGYSILLYLVNFGILLVLLWYFLYRPVIKMLEDRQETISKSVKQAEAIEKRVAAIESEREEVIQKAKNEAADIAEKATRAGEQRHEEIVSAAKREVERVIVKGKQQLQDEKAQMLVEVRKDIVDIAVKASARIVSTGMDEAKSKSLAEEVVRKMT